MKIKRQWIVTLFCALALLANGASILAQEGKQNTFTRSSGGGGGVGVWTQEGGKVSFQFSDDTFVFASSEFGGRVVKGAPYSAEVITEHVQTLADGNRIVRRSSSSVYRDSEGRTRREQTIRAIGPNLHVGSGEQMQTIFINDPVAETNYVLDPQKRIARRMHSGLAKMRLEETMRAMKEKKEVLAAGKAEEADSEKQAKEHKAKLRAIEAEHAAHVDMLTTEGGNVSFRTSIKGDNAKNAKTESLGKQMFDGVEAEGTRTTITIPAGEIGNELPIEIVSERWYSPELQVNVMTRHSDPRSGENIYRLSNINRTEPARFLFEVPGDYTVEESRERVKSIVTPMHTKKRPDNQ